MINQTETKTEKTYKQSPEVRKYFADYHRERRLKLAKCTCGSKEPATFKDLKSKIKLCDNCVAKEILKRRKEKEAKNAMSQVQTQ